MEIFESFLMHGYTLCEVFWPEWKVAHFFSPFQNKMFAEYTAYPHMDKHSPNVK